MAEKIDFIDSIGILRKDLIDFTKEIEVLNPSIKFDYSEMDKLAHKNLWFVDILTD